MRGIPVDFGDLQEECAVFGIYAPGRDVARMTYFGLQALQHRGQESAGIAVGDGDTVVLNKGLGLVTNVFDEAGLARMHGGAAIGHTRYSTSGGEGVEAAQPHLSAIGEELFALAHNGTLVNTAHLRVELVERGILFNSTTDSEVAAKLIGYFTRNSHHMREGIRRTMELIEGAYAMVLATSTALYAFRDPNGIRPLVLGRLADGAGSPGTKGAAGSWVVASETCGLDIVGATYVRDVEPGEILRVNSEGLVSEQAVKTRRYTPCIFEQVYFARPDSVVRGATVYQTRVALGRRLALEAPAQADLVIGVPDSGIPGAIGYAAQSGIPYAEGIVKNRYVGRTFIQPTQELRKLGIKLKLNAMSAAIAGKRLVVIDDSIVRGNTSRQLVQMLREAGAREVHLRIVSPEVKWPCFYGIDTDTQDQLISARNTPAQVCGAVGADSLAFLSLRGLVECAGKEGRGRDTPAAQGCGTDAVGAACGQRAECADAAFCTACFNGVYPVRIPERLSRGSYLEGVVPPVNGDE